MYSYSFNWLFSIIIIILINFNIIKSSDFKPTNGEAGYCTLDQVKYGGMNSCTPGPDIDYTPIHEKKDFAYYAGKITDVASIVAPVSSLPGSEVGAPVQVVTTLLSVLANNYKAGSAENALNSQLSNIIDQVNMKIDNEIIRVKECLKSFVLEEIEEGLHIEIAEYMETIMSYNDITDAIVAENRWDDIIKDTNNGLIDFGSTWFSNYDNLDEIPFYYELRLSDFDYYNNLFGPTSGIYFIAKQRLCNNPNRTNPIPADSCRVEHNIYLNRARDLIEDMNIWVIKALAIIRDEIYSYPILSKDFDASGDFPLHRNQKTAGDSVVNHRLDRLDFGENFYGEAKTHILDLDDGKRGNNGKDVLTVWIRMTSEYDEDKREDINKICELPDTVDCDIRVDRTGTGPRRENLRDSCKDALTKAAINKREEFRNEIDQYWYNLITKYLSPMQSRIDSLYSIPYLNPSSGNEYSSQRVAEDKARADSLLYTLTTEGRIRFQRGSGCLTLDEGNNNAHFSPCNGQSNQIWRLRDIDNNGYALIISKYNNKCLDVNYGGEGEDNIYATGCNANTPDQRWKITSNSIINGAKRVGYQNCFDGHREASDDNARAVRCNEDDQNQQIIFRQESIIKATVTNECVRVESGDGGNVIRGDCNGDINERWELRQIGNDGFYALISSFNNKCLHVSGNRGDNEVNRGDRVISDVCKYGINQLWKINRNMLISKGNYCLDVNHGQAIDVIVGGCDENNDNQMVVLPGFLSSVSN